MSDDRKLLLLDGHSLIYRAFFALPLLRTSTGRYTNAVYGFTKMLFRLLEEEQPDLVAVAFDSGKPTFRHKEYDQYKAQRLSMPDELVEQFQAIREILDAAGVRMIAVPGYEADDIIGTLAQRAGQNHFQTGIVTSDRDTLQLIDEQTEVLVTRKGITDIKRMSLEAFRKEYGVEPEMLVDVKALMGDASDNIPGIPGIGEKTALKLVGEFGKLEDIYEHLDDVSGVKLKERLQGYRDDAFLSKRLATICREVPIASQLDWEELELGKRDDDRLFELFRQLEFHSLIKELGIKQEKVVQLGARKSELVTDLDRVNELARELLSVKRFSFLLLCPDEKGQDLMGITVVPEGKNSSFIPLRNDRKPGQGHLPFAKNEEHGESLTREQVLEIFKEALESHKVEKVTHDAKTAYVALKRFGIKLCNVVFDTMVAAYLVDPGMPNTAIRDLAVCYLHYQVPVVDLEADVETLSKTSCLTAAAVGDLYQVLLKELSDKQLTDLFVDVELPLTEVLAEMEEQGITIDVDFLGNLQTELDGKLEAIMAQIHNLCGEKFNINSPKQLSHILFTKLGLPVIKKTKTGYSTDMEVLEKLSAKHAVPALILEFRQIAKLKSTYVDGLLKLVDRKTHRIHTTFKQTVTATGRLSSSEPNLQNIPIRMEEGRRIRRAFIPREDDWLFIACDYSQIELRVLAHITCDEGLIDAFKNDQDIHTRTASEVFGVPMDEVTRELRSRAKAVNFGIAYGMTDYGLAQDLGVSRKEAQEYIDLYFSRYPRVREYMDSIVKVAHQEGYVTTLLNRRRYLPEINSRHFSRRKFAERTAINTPIQGTAADIIKVAMVRVARHLKEQGFEALMLLQIHDELVFEAPKRELDKLINLVKKDMEGAISLKVPLKIDIKTGQNLYEMKEI